MKRPLRTRVWFYTPAFHWFGWAWFSPFRTGGDEFNWHTIVLGWNWSGSVCIATRPCDGTGKCAAELDDPEWKPEWTLATPWPIDIYGHDHSGAECNCDGCKEDAA